MILIGLACLGMACGIVGSILPMSEAQKWLFLANTLLMTPLPFAKKDTMLSALQIVSLSGAAVGVLTLINPLQIVLPLAVALLVTGFLYWKDKLDSWKNRIGAAGIAALALGYATQQPLVYLLGGLILTVYTWLSFRAGSGIALLWFVLNVVFVMTSIWASYLEHLG